MVRTETVTETVTAYICERCGSRYPNALSARACESAPIHPFLYGVGQRVRARTFGSDGKAKLSVGKVIERWRHGISERGEAPHGNRYKLELEGGLIQGCLAVCWESQIEGVVS